MNQNPIPEELPELPDLPDLPAAPAGAAPAGPAGGPPPLRVLDKAPMHLRQAALIVTAASLLPWMPGKIEGEAGNAWLLTLLAKVIMGSAAWLWLQQVKHDFGPKLVGGLAGLANLHLAPKKKEEPDDGKEKRRPKPKAGAAVKLEHPFPTGLHALAVVLVIAAVVIGSQDPRRALIGSAGTVEIAMFGWAAFTWVHIASYERWGGFNPLFPLMFLGMLFAGAMGVIVGVAGDLAGLARMMAVLGGAGVAGGGGLAAYTIAEALMQAKKDGDRKKAEALEARKASRKKE
ncbi:MAG: hypothetical protein ABL998_23820, partial [Planctomycetota bacterium]